MYESIHILPKLSLLILRLLLQSDNLKQSCVFKIRGKVLTNYGKIYHVWDIIIRKAKKEICYDEG